MPSSSTSWQVGQIAHLCFILILTTRDNQRALVLHIDQKPRPRHVHSQDYFICDEALPQPTSGIFDSPIHHLLPNVQIMLFTILGWIHYFEHPFLHHQIFHPCLQAGWSDRRIMHVVGKVPDIQNQNQNLDSKSESESDRRILGIVGKVPDMQNPDCRSQTTHVLDLFVSVGIWTLLPMILAKSLSCLFRMNI